MRAIERTNGMIRFAEVNNEREGGCDSKPMKISIDTDGTEICECWEYKGHKGYIRADSGYTYIKNYYFTFGTDEQFPYPSRYMVVQAENHNQAIQLFRVRHPDRPGHEGIYNASDSYDETYWLESVSKYYVDQPPAETIRIDITGDIR
jgi:hypothetical protein